MNINHEKTIFRIKFFVMEHSKTLLKATVSTIFLILLAFNYKSVETYCIKTSIFLSDSEGLNLQIITNCFVIATAAFIAYQAYIVRKDYVEKNRRADLEKAVELSKFFADYIIPRVSYLNNVFQSAGLEQYFKFINAEDMSSFMQDELIYNMGSVALARKIQSKDFRVLYSKEDTIAFIGEENFESFIEQVRSLKLIELLKGHFAYIDMYDTFDKALKELQTGNSSTFRIITERLVQDDFYIKSTLELTNNAMNNLDQFDCDDIINYLGNKALNDYTEKYLNVTYDVLMLCKFNDGLCTHSDYSTSNDYYLNLETSDDQKSFLQQERAIFRKARTELLNNLEYFAMSFNEKIADESAIYQSLHQIFNHIVKITYIEISKSNTDSSEKHYTHIIKLFNKWKKKKVIHTFIENEKERKHYAKSNKRKVKSQIKKHKSLNKQRIKAEKANHKKEEIEKKFELEIKKTDEQSKKEKKHIKNGKTRSSKK